MTPHEPNLPFLPADLWATAPIKMVLSQPTPANERGYIKIIIHKQQNSYQVERFSATQAFHESLGEKEAFALVQSLVPSHFGQLNLWNEKEEIQLRASKKGKLLLNRQPLQAPIEEKSSHNRQKNYILPQGQPIAPLVDMGILTPKGKVIDAMQHKYRQINRFLETIEDCLPHLPKEGPLHIIDFGCGKSYLTFVLYYYFTQIKNRSVYITGLDLKKEVIEKCSLTAQKYGYDQLTFLQGDIKDHIAANSVDMVISLHACDTATDYALAFGIRHQARAILAVPCCQHEINQQMKTDAFSLITRYGLIKERSAALLTDAIRASLLTACGYKSQVLEFIDMAHTPKNILIRALKSNLPLKSKTLALKEVHALCEAFSLHPTLLTLLQEADHLPSL